MLAEYKHSLMRLRGQIIGWAAGVAAYGLMMVYFYPYFGDLGDFMNEFLAMIPTGMSAFFESLHIIGTPMGYIDVYYFSYLHLIVGVLAIGTGAGLLAGDEESGILDLVLAHPVSRTRLFLGRWLALVTALAIILGTGWLSWTLPADRVGLGLNWLQLLWPFLSLFALLLVFSALSLFLSMVTPSARIASMTTGALLVGNYLLRALSNINGKLEAVLKFTPLRYYQAGKAVEGLNGSWLTGLLVVASLIVIAAWILFLQRDIRVSGERNWSWPGLYGPGRRNWKSDS